MSEQPMSEQPPSRTPLVSVLIPAFNEAAGLDALISRLTPVLDGLPVRWEIVFVDDGSSDATLAKLKDIAAADPRVAAIALSRNFGKEIAIAAGLTYVRGDACIIMDSDLQHPPEVLKAFVARWQEGYQVVYGQRLDRSTDSATRTFFSRNFYKLYNALVDTDIPDGAGDFRLLDRRAIDAMNELKETARFNKGLFSWIGFKAIGVPYTVAERAHGTTKWSFRRLLSFAIDGLTSFSTLPLRVWSMLGLAISLVAFAYAIFVLAQTLIYGVAVPGFPTLVISVMFFSGVQLISLGVLGEYLGRVYAEVKRRPLFLVGEEIGFGAQAPRTESMPPRRDGADTGGTTA